MYAFIDFLEGTRGHFPLEYKKSWRSLGVNSSGTKRWASSGSGLYGNVLISLSCCQVWGLVQWLKHQRGYCDENQKWRCLIYYVSWTTSRSPYEYAFVYYNTKRHLWQQGPLEIVWPPFSWAGYRQRQYMQHFQQECIYTLPKASSWAPAEAPGFPALLCGRYHCIRCWWTYLIWKHCLFATSI